MADTCPCSGSNDSCTLNDIFYSIGGDSTEALLRTFGNMGLRHYDGSVRPALNNVWQMMLARPRQP